MSGGVTREERNELILSMFVPQGHSRSPEEVLRALGTDDGSALSLQILREGLQRNDEADVEFGLMAGFEFGFTSAHLDILIDLLPAPWHYRHEDVVLALQEFRTPEAIPALVHATQWIPEYLEFDEFRALATKAIWALGDIPGRQAEQELMRLAESDHEILRTTAATVLSRRARDPELPST